MCARFAFAMIRGQATALVGALLWAGMATVAFAQSSAAGPAPELTIDTLVRLRQAELQDEFSQRVKKLQPAPPPVAAPSKPASAAAFLALPAPPQPPKRVAAIYGRIGSEVADIEMPDGEVLKVMVGSRIEGWRVTSITAVAGVEIKGFAPPKGGKSSQRSTKVRGGGEEIQESTVRVPLGGSFE